MLNMLTGKLLYGTAAVLMITASLFGMSMTFPAFTLPAIKKTFILSEFEETMFNAIPSLLAIGGPFVFQPWMEKKGRKFTTRLIGISAFLSYLIFWIANENTKIFLFIHRATIGLIMGGISSVMPTYFVEIANNSQKDLFGTLNQIGVSTGVVLGNILGGILEWRTFCFICITVSFFVIVASFFIAESPAFLNLEKSTKSDQNSSKKLFSGEFNNEIRKGLLFMIFQQFSGVNAVLTNAGEVLNGSVPAAALSASAQLFSCIVCSSIISKLGCRKAWNISCGGAFLSLVLFSMCNAFNLNTTIKGIAIFGYQLSFGFGLGPIPWIKTPVLFPDDVRGSSSSFLAATNWISSFIVVSIFPMLNNLFGLTLTFLFFGVFMVFAILSSSDINSENAKPASDYILDVDLELAADFPNESESSSNGF